MENDNTIMLIYSLHCREVDSKLAIAKGRNKYKCKRRNNYKNKKIAFNKRVRRRRKKKGYK